jgi:hypothetical protein
MLTTICAGKNCRPFKDIQLAEFLFRCSGDL